MLFDVVPNLFLDLTGMALYSDNQQWVAETKFGHDYILVLGQTIYAAPHYPHKFRSWRYIKVGVSNLR
jgi:hypothetical protein